MAWLNESQGPGVATWTDDVPANTGSGKTTEDVDFSSAQDIFEQYKSARQEEWDWNAQQADLNRQFQEDQNALAMEYNSAEAQKNREWQEMMSSTSIQRQVADMKAAGINPVLAAKYMGASSGSGSSASISGQSGSMAASGTTSGQLLSLIGNLIQQNTSITSALIGKDATLGAAKITQDTQLSVEEMKEEFEKYIKRNFPSNQTEALFSIVYNIRDDLLKTFSGSDMSDNMVKDFWNLAYTLQMKFDNNELYNCLSNLQHLLTNYAPDVISKFMNQALSLLNDAENLNSKLEEYKGKFSEWIKDFFNKEGKG